MERQDDIIAFSQSEKLKTGIIWIQQIANSYLLSGEEGKAGLKIALDQMLGLLGHEIYLAKRVSAAEDWHEVEKFYNKAVTMLNSDPHALGVQECVYHLTQALSRITNIGQRSMEKLFNGA